MAMMDGPHFDRAMTEGFRVLRPGGRLAFSITHPCFITKGSRWLRDAEGRKIQWVVGDYFNDAGWVERWRFTDAPSEAPEFATPRFDRTPLRVPQYRPRRRLRAQADRGAETLGRILRRSSQPARLA